MINLRPYNGSTIEFLDEVVGSKRNSSVDPSYTQRLSTLTPSIKRLYSQYDIVHRENNHATMMAYGFQNQDKTDLLKLYSSSNSNLTRLKNSITTFHDNRVMSKCQYCTISEVSSLDHIIPKTEFPEFSVNPKNLLPACTICNSKKSVNWRESDKPVFLNLYTDRLPRDQYLFVDLDFSNNTILPTFNLINKNNIPQDFFNLLESHYSKLDLLNRFARNSNDIITNLINSVKPLMRKLSHEEVKDVILEFTIKNKAIFGSNHYKSILEETLISDENFLNIVD